MANEFDKLYSLQQIELWLAHPEQCSPRIRNDIFKQLADVMRELKYYKALAHNLSTGTAQPSIPNQQNPYSGNVPLDTAMRDGYRNLAESLKADFNWDESNKESGNG